MHGREICHFKAFTQTFKQTNIQLYRQRKLEYRLDEHLKFTGKTSDQRKCSRSTLGEAYVDKRVAGKKGSTNKYRYRPTSAGEKSNAPSDGLVDLWRCGHLPPPNLACVMQDLKLYSFNLQWFLDLGASFSRFGCSVFDVWVLCFRLLGASFSRLGCFVLRSSFSKLTKMTMHFCPHVSFRLHQKLTKFKLTYAAPRESFGNHLVK